MTVMLRASSKGSCCVDFFGVLEVDLFVVGAFFAGCCCACVIEQVAVIAADRRKLHRRKAFTGWLLDFGLICWDVPFWLRTLFAYSVAVKYVTLYPFKRGGTTKTTKMASRIPPAICKIIICSSRLGYSAGYFWPAMRASSARRSFRRGRMGLS